MESINTSDAVILMQSPPSLLDFGQRHLSCKLLLEHGGPSYAEHPGSDSHVCACLGIFFIRTNKTADDHWRFDYCDPCVGTARFARWQTDCVYAYNNGVGEWPQKRRHLDGSSRWISAAQRIDRRR